jgi:hypothetical protein
VTAAHGTTARNRREDPVFRTASALVLLVGIQELLATFPMLPQPVGALRLPADSTDIAIRMLVERLAVPVVCVICGALMPLRRSAAAAVVAVLVAFLELLVLAPSLVGGFAPPVPVLFPVLVLVAGIWAVGVTRSRV